MKAKIKETGEIVDVEPYFYAKINSTDPMIHKNDIELIEPNADIDYEQRRYEIAKEALTAIMSNNEFYSLVLDVSREKGNRDITKSVSEAAVCFADALIEELKKRK